MVDLSVGTADIDLVEVGQEVTLSISSDSSAVDTGPGGFGPGAFGAADGGRGAVPGGDRAQAGDDSDTASAAVVTVTGTVAEVSGVADASSGVATFTVGVEFSDDTGEIWAGSTATAEINVAARPDVTQVSSAAITTTDGVSTVTVALEGSLDGPTEVRDVLTGETSGRVTEIVSGLEPGDQVVLEATVPGIGARNAGGAGPPEGFEVPEGFSPPGGADPAGGSADAGAGS